MQKVYIEQQELIFILSWSVFIWMTKIITKVENSADVIHSYVTNHKKKKVRQQFISLTCLNYSWELLPFFLSQIPVWISQWFKSNSCAKHCIRHTRWYLVIPFREILKLQILGLQICHMVWSGCRVPQKFWRYSFCKSGFSNTKMLQDTWNKILLNIQELTQVQEIFCYVPIRNRKFIKPLP